MVDLWGINLAKSVRDVCDRNLSTFHTKRNANQCIAIKAYNVISMRALLKQRREMKPTNGVWAKWVLSYDVVVNGLKTFKT